MKDKKIFISIISIFTIISFIIGVSYAYFTPIIIGNDTASSHHTKAGTLRLTYNGTNVLSLPNASPGDSASTTFTVTNSGTLPVNSYEIYFSKLVNQFINDEVVYTLTCTSNDSNPCQNKEQTPVPTSEELVLTQGSITPNTTHTYTLTVTFISKNEPQDYNQGKELRFTMTINEMEELPPSTLIAREYNLETNFISNEYFWEYYENITEITFENIINIPANAFKSWDVSANQDNSIMAYIIDDGLDNNTYHLYVQSNTEILANSDSFGLFSNFSKLTMINNLNLLNTSNVTNMMGIFAESSSLTTLDLSTFDTSNVTNMSYMFAESSSLTTLDLSNFNTINVTRMYSMFSGCRSLASVDLSSFNTSSVTTMSGMFSGCRSLASVDLSSFNTSNVTNMESMFEGCNSLANLDLSSFDTSNVTNMSSMFSGNQYDNLWYDSMKIEDLDLSSFNTESVTNMSGMFGGCIFLSSLDLSGFNTTNVTDMSHMFNGCSSLTNLSISKFNTSSVTKMRSMFSGCSSLTNLDLSNFTTSSVTDMRNMFGNCSGLTNLNLRNANFATVTSYSSMFSYITSGINIIAKDVDAQTFINARLSDVSRTGNITIYVP